MGPSKHRKVLPATGGILTALLFLAMGSTDLFGQAQRLAAPNPVGRAAADDEYYHQFLSEVDTSLRVPHIFTSPLITDSKNTAGKLTNSAVSVKQTAKTGEIAGVKLGMTMDEVVAVWGKPLQVRWRYGGRVPSLCFEGVHLVFKGNRLERIHILDRTFLFEEGLGYRSREAEWTRILGKPTTRSEAGAARNVFYETSQASLHLFLVPESQVEDIFLEFPVPGDEIKE